MCDLFGFTADTHKILISSDFPLSKLVEKSNSEKEKKKSNSENDVVLFFEEHKVFFQVYLH